MNLKLDIKKKRNIQNSKKMNDPSFYQEKFVPLVRKELNIYGKLAILGGVFFLGFFCSIKLVDKYAKSAFDQKVRQLEDKMLTYHTYRDKKHEQKLISLASLDDINDLKRSLNSRYNEKLRNLEEKIRKDMMKKLQEKEVNLEKKISYLNQLKTEVLDNSHLEKKSYKIPYSQVNLDILYNQHLYEVKELKNKHQNELMEIAKVFGSNKSVDNLIYEKLVNKHKLELNALRSRQRNQRQDFKKKKFTYIFSSVSLYDRF